MDCIILETSDGGFILVKDGDIVGRSATGREVLLPFTKISRRHVQFFYVDAQWFAVDLGSKNGTFLNGKKLDPNNRVKLDGSDRLKISTELELTVRMDSIKQADSAMAPSQDDSSGASRKELCIMFADLKGSVDYFQEKGTMVARQWILKFYEMLTSIVKSHNGTHLKNIGDAILAVFDNARDAALAASEIQRAVLEHNKTANESEHYSIRIGMNTGMVIFENNDVFGNAVNIASRVQNFAPPSRICVTERFYEKICNCKEINTEYKGQHGLKGVQGDTGIYEILYLPHPKPTASETNR